MKSLFKMTNFTVFSAVLLILSAAQGCVQIEFPETMNLSLLLNEANRAYRAGNYPTALSKCEEAFQTSKNIGDPEQLPYRLNEIVETCEKLTEHEKLPPMSTELANLIAERQSELAKKEKADTLLQEARVTAKQGAFQETFDTLEKAQDIHESMVSLEKDWVSVEMALVVVMHSLGSEEEALVELEPRLLALIERLDTEDRIVAQWLSSLARAHEQLGQYEKASTYYRQAQAMKQQLGDERAQEFGVYHTGKLYEKQGQYEKALELYQQERTRRKKAGDTKEEVDALHKIVWVYHQIPQYDTALEVEQEILAIQQTSGFPADVVLTFTRIASLNNMLGHYDNALDAYREALARYQEMEEPAAQQQAAQVMQFIGFIYRDLGQYEKAITLQEQARELWAQAEADSMLSHAQRLEAHYREKPERKDLQAQIEEYYWLAEAARAGKGQTVQYVLIQLAKSYQMADRSRQAEGILLQALAIVQERTELLLEPLRKQLEQAQKTTEMSERDKEQAVRGNAALSRKRHDEAYVLDEIGTFYKDREQYETSLEFYQQALAIYREIQTHEAPGMRRSEGTTLDRIGTVSVALGKYEQALTFYQEALTIYRESNQNRDIIRDLWTEERILDNIGVAYEKSGQYEQAVMFHREALDMAEESRIPERIWHNNHATGRALAKLGKHDEALQHYERAIDTIESVRAELKEKEHKLSFMRDKLYVYDELIDWLQTLHRKHPDKDYDRKALEISERK